MAFTSVLAPVTVRLAAAGIVTTLLLPETTTSTQVPVIVTCLDALVDGDRAAQAVDDDVGVRGRARREQPGGDGEGGGGDERGTGQGARKDMSRCCPAPSIRNRARRTRAKSVVRSGPALPRLWSSCGSRTDPTRVRGGAPVRPLARRVPLLMLLEDLACLPLPPPSPRSSSPASRSPTPTAPSCPGSTCSPSRVAASASSARTASASPRCCAPSPGGSRRGPGCPAASRRPTTSCSSARNRRSATGPRSPTCSP